jgi:hypothetical protein
MITIKFNTDNDAFYDCEGLESSRIIVDLCKHLEFHSMKLKNNTYIIKDVNGHKIGTMETNSEQTNGGEDINETD